MVNRVWMYIFLMSAMTSGLTEPHFAEDNVWISDIKNEEQTEAVTDEELPSALCEVVSDLTAEKKQAAVLGADLTQELKNRMLEFFGISEEDMNIVQLTNEQEKEQLKGMIPDGKIGNRTYSCAVVSLTGRGGVQAETVNLSYVTADMIASAMVTAGISNCEVIAAAPDKMSGTGAFPAAVLAYETATGEKLDGERKSLAVRELTLIDRLGNVLGRNEAVLLVNSIKLMILQEHCNTRSEIVPLTDAALDCLYYGMEERSAGAGRSAEGKMSRDLTGELYAYGYRLGNSGCEYDPAQITLERIINHSSEKTGICTDLEFSEDIMELERSDEISMFNRLQTGALGSDPETDVTWGCLMTEEFHDLTDEEITHFEDHEGELKEDLSNVYTEYSPGERVPPMADGVEIRLAEIEEIRELCRFENDSAAVETEVPSENSAIEEADLSPEREIRTRGVTLTKLRDIPGGYWIDGTALINVQDDEKTTFAVQTPEHDGTCADGFERLDGTFGYAVGCRSIFGKSFYGLVGSDGQLIIRSVYEKLDVLSPRWAVALKLKESSDAECEFREKDGTPCRISYADIYFLEGDHAVLAASLDRSQISSWCGAGDYVNIKDRSTGVISCYDKNWNLIASDLSSISQKQESSRSFGIRTVTGENGKTGLCNEETGEYLVPAEFDSFIYTGFHSLDMEQNTPFGYVSNNYAQGTRSEEIIFYNTTDHTEFSSGKKKKDVYDYGATLLYHDEEGNTHLISADGEDNLITAEADDDLEDLGTEGMTDQGDEEQRTCGDDGEDLLIEEDNKLFLMDDFMESSTIVVVEDDISDRGSEESAGTKSFCRILPSEYGSGMFYDVTDEEGRYGLIDWHGDLLFPTEYRRISISADGRYLLANRNGWTSELYRIGYSDEADR